MNAITDKPGKSSLSVTTEEPTENCTFEEREAFMAGFEYADKDQIITPWKALNMWLRERDETS